MGKRIITSYLFCMTEACGDINTAPNFMQRAGSLVKDIAQLL
ncbi:hypothetical protein NIES2104_07340 [Leptolyngbya sp. NIES-2104]|nr:hypothetical protein NIES2104_07340 [Leptolyngbya sp. NIES-2104]